MPGGGKTITDKVRERSATDRAALMRWVMSKAAASDASVDWAFRAEGEGHPPEADAYYGMQYAYVKFPEAKPDSCPLTDSEWARLRAEHPFGVKVRVVNQKSEPRPIIHESCLQFIESYEHALKVLLSDLKNAARRTGLLNSLQQQVERFKAVANSLRPKTDDEHESMAERAETLKKNFHSVACNFYALMDDAALASRSLSAQQKKVEGARKALEVAVNRYRAPRLCTDILVVDVGEVDVDAAVRGEEFDSASWQYYRRHTLRRARVDGAAYHRDHSHDSAGGPYEPTATAHDPDYNLANFAVVSQGVAHCCARPEGDATSAVEADVDPGPVRVLTVDCSSVTSRFGSPSPAKAYSGHYLSGDCKLSRHEAVRHACSNMLDVLRNEVALVHDSGVSYQAMKEMGGVCHMHVHLLSDASDSAQDQQIQDCAIAAYALRDCSITAREDGEAEVTIPARFRYMDIGANWMRRAMSRQMYGMASMTLVDLFNSARASFGKGFLAGVELNLTEYVAEVDALSSAARAYINSGEVIHFDSVEGHEYQAHSLAMELSNSLKTQLQSTTLRQAVLAAPTDPQQVVGSVAWRQYYAQQVMFTIMQLMPHVNCPWGSEPFRNRARKNAFSNSCNCVLQALVPVLSDMLGEFGSSACKSNNDRAALVALRVSVFAQRMASGERITEGDLKAFAADLNKATAKQFEQSATHDHTEADCAGARSKGFPGDGRELTVKGVNRKTAFYGARGVAATIKSSSAATHKAVKWSVVPMPALYACVVPSLVRAGGEDFARRQAAGVLQEYRDKYADTTSQCLLFGGHHRRHTAVNLIISKINMHSCTDQQAARLLVFWTRSIERCSKGSSALSIGRQALQGLLGNSFGGVDLTVGSESCEARTLCKQGVLLPDDPKERRPTQDEFKDNPELQAKWINLTMQRTMIRLFNIVESMHSDLAFQRECMPAVFGLINGLNAAIVTSPSCDEEGFVDAVQAGAKGIELVLNGFYKNFNSDKTSVKQGVVQEIMALRNDVELQFNQFDSAESFDLDSDSTSIGSTVSSMSV